MRSSSSTATRSLRLTKVGFAFAEKNDSCTDFVTALGCHTPLDVLHTRTLPHLSVNSRACAKRDDIFTDVGVLTKIFF